MLGTELSVQIGGIMTIGVGAAGLTMPKALNLHEELNRLSPFVRRLMWTYYGYIAGTIAAILALSLGGAHLLTDGSTLARLVCGYITLFWGVRLVVGLAGFHAAPYLTTIWHRIGYIALTSAFPILTAIYAAAAIAPAGGIRP